MFGALASPWRRPTPWGTRPRWRQYDCLGDAVRARSGEEELAIFRRLETAWEGSHAAPGESARTSVRTPMRGVLSVLVLARDRA
jgi:hypothetical protein